MTPVNAQESPSTPTRPPVTISPNLDKRLFGYAAAATAAGVGMLALTQSAEAKIIYTPADLVVHRNAGLVQFDVNNDGIPDFGIYSSVESGGARTGARVRPPLGFYARFINVVPAQTANEVGEVTSVHGSHCAAELHAGLKIGGGKTFQGGYLPMFAVAGDYTSPGTPHCPWNNKGGYLGLKFVVSGQTYYGWAHISLTTGSPVITGYAYENVPNKSILAGATSGADESASIAQPPALPSPPQEFASLGLLACGSSGLSVWRRPEEMN
jgi:hypothetical protein